MKQDSKSLTVDERAPTLRVRGAVKRFGAVLAIDDVDLSAYAGEVLALLGDNGAGKSTLIKCISGVHRLDSGSTEIDGSPQEIHTPEPKRATSGLKPFIKTSPCSTIWTPPRI